MAELYRINKSTLEDLADTVRTATGQTGPISFDQIEAVAKESIIISNGGTSGGGSVETCTITFEYIDPVFMVGEIDVYYTDVDMQVKSLKISDNTSIQVVKNTIIAIDNSNSNNDYGSGLISLTFSPPLFVFLCAGDSNAELLA